MKSFTVASAFLAAVAVAQPHGTHNRRHEQLHEKRALVTEVEWVTETQYVTKLVDSTTTVWVTPGEELPTSTTDKANFIETSASPIHKKKKKPTTTSTTTTTTTSEYVAPEPTTTTTTSSVYVAPTTSTTFATSTSVYVAPEETTTSVEEPESTTEEPESTTEEYVEPEPTTTSVYVAPTSVYVAPTSTYVAPVATTSASSDDGSSGGGSGSYTGEITYYDLGLNACGGNAAGEDYSTNLVAISHAIMGDGPTLESNPFCGKTITIKANGKVTTATVRDKCMGCAEGDIDVSKKIFTSLFGGLGKGRVSDIEWSFN